MKKMSAIRRPTQGRAWNDLMNVQRRVLIPSPLASSLTSLATRNNRSMLTDTISLSGCHTWIIYFWTNWNDGAPTEQNMNGDAILFNSAFISISHAKATKNILLVHFEG